MNEEIININHGISVTDLVRNTSRFPKIGKKPVYNFKEVEETDEEFKGICKCCAYCNYGNVSQQNVMIEQQMIMDCVFSVVSEENLWRSSVYNYPGWQAGKWKALIRTRLCQNCINELKNKADSSLIIPEDLFNDEEAKRQRIDDNLEVGNTQQIHMDEIENTNMNEIEINSDNIFIQSPEIENFREPIEGPTFGIMEITWIKYILEYPPNPALPEGDPNWRYFYPSEEYLTGICEVHGIHFDKYPFAGYENFYNSLIFDRTNLLTVKINPDISSGFRTLSYLISGNEHSFAKIKTLIQYHIQQHYLPQSFYMVYHSSVNTFDDSIRECDLYAAANLFHLNIFSFNFYNNGKWFLINESGLQSSSSKIFTQFLPHRPSILISKTFDNLYNPVLAVAD